MADEPVVVIKVQPEKAGNSVEGKTELIIGIESDEVDAVIHKTLIMTVIQVVCEQTTKTAALIFAKFIN